MNSINPIKSTLTSEYALKSEIGNYRAKRCPNSPRVNASLSCHLFYVNIPIKGIVHPKTNILLSFHFLGQIFSPMLVNQTVLVLFKLHCILSKLFDHQHSLKYCILRSTEERIFIFGLTVPLKGAVCNIDSNRLKWILQSKVKILEKVASSAPPPQTQHSCRLPD